MTLPTLFSYLPHEAAVALCKMAEVEKKPHPLKPILAGGIGTVVGILAGYGGAQLADMAYHRVTGKSIPHKALLAAVPALTGGLGLAYNLAQTRQIEELRRAAESPDHKS